MMLFLYGYLAGFISLPCVFVALLWLVTQADWADAGCSDAPTKRS